MIPKDIIMCDWHYERKYQLQATTQSIFPSVRIFIDKGFRVLPTSFRTSRPSRRSSTSRWPSRRTRSSATSARSGTRSSQGQYATLPQLKAASKKIKKARGLTGPPSSRRRDQVPPPELLEPLLPAARPRPRDSRRNSGPSSGRSAPRAGTRRSSGGIRRWTGWFIHMWRNSGSLTGKAPTKRDVLDRVAAGVPALLEEEDLAEIFLGPHPELPEARHRGHDEDVLGPVLLAEVQDGLGAEHVQLGVAEVEGEADLEERRVAVEREDLLQAVAVVVRGHPDRGGRPAGLDDLGVVDLVGLDAGLAEEVLEAAVGIEAPLAERPLVGGSPSPARA